MTSHNTVRARKDPYSSTATSNEGAISKGDTMSPRDLYHYMTPLYTKEINGAQYSIVLAEGRDRYGNIVQEMWATNIITGRWKFLGPA